MRDRIPPHDQDAEKAVLGSMILDPRAVDSVTLILKPSDFYFPTHQILYQTIVQLRDANTPIDVISLAKELNHKKSLEQVGGAAYLSDLTNSVPTSANAAVYANIVRDTSILRSLISLCNDIIAQCYSNTDGSKIILENAERRILELAVNRQAHQVMMAKEMSIKLTSEIQRLTEQYTSNNKTVLSGIPTGYSVLDRAINGLNKSEFIIIAARTSLGKTTLAINIASHIALNLKRPVGYFSLEMPWMKLGFRIIASESHIDLYRLQRGELRPSDQNAIAYAVSQLYEAPLYIDDTPHISLLDLRAQARRMVNQYKVEAIFIDYISIISVENKNLPRHEQVAEISRSLMNLSRELNIPIVALSQVTRDSEGKRPGLHNLRESGSLEQDADIIIFLHREREYQRDEKDSGGPIPTELIVAKNRQGDTTVIPMMFIGNQTRFELAEIDR